MGANISKRRRLLPLQHALVTSALLRKSPVPREHYVTVKALAKELGLRDPERLRSVIEHQYIRLLEVREYFQDCVVARPYPAGIEWLREMFRPLTLRPFLPLSMAATLLSTNISRVRRYCLAYDYPIYDDQAFGELISIRHFHRLFDRVRESNDGVRFDRAAIISLLRDVMHSEGQHDNERSAYRPNPLPYSKRLELEIIKIGKLKEPDRTLRAVAFYEAYRDANTIRECVARYKELTLGLEEKVEERLAKLMQRCVGVNPNQESLLSDQPADDDSLPETESGHL